ncbi:D-tyrosyl-tRNA(Tyr) deacylase [Ceratobasidium sp. 395]|nr:D-tyrosyl-tRNA(Tyr) deacylase [Ceratobasidium sp. 395]
MLKTILQKTRSTLLTRLIGVFTPVMRLSLKIFDDPNTGSMWKQSVKDVGGEILCVSQFTLMAKTVKGVKPDFHKASVVDTYLISDGQFGAMMSVSLTNEGPVTITIDSRKFEYTPVVEPNSRRKPTDASDTANQAESK